MQVLIMAPRYSDNELERIVQQTPAVMPVAYHLSAPACLDKFLQPTFKQLLVHLVPLNIVDSNTLIEFGESLEVPPCIRVSTKGMNDFGQDDKFRIQVGTSRTASVCHHTHLFEPPATLLVEFGPSSALASRTETLERYAIHILDRRIYPSEA